MNFPLLGWWWKNVWEKRNNPTHTIGDLVMDPKAGYATTEFWSMAAAFIVNVASQHGLTLETGTVAAALAMVYTVCRTILKAVQAKTVTAKGGK